MSLRDRLRVTCLDSAGRGDRVDNIALAVPPAHLAIRPAQLDNPDAALPQIPRQPGTITARALHTDLLNRAMLLEPAEQLRIAGGCRREAGSSEHTAEVIEHRGDMHVKVRVDTTSDQGRGCCHRGQCPSFISRCRGGHGATEIGQDRDGPEAAGSY